MKNKERKAIKEEKKQTKDESYWLAIGMCIGISVGTTIGAAFNNISFWLPIGLCIGLCFGAVFSNANDDK